MKSCTVTLWALVVHPPMLNILARKATHNHIALQYSNSHQMASLATHADRHNSACNNIVAYWRVGFAYNQKFKRKTQNLKGKSRFQMLFDTRIPSYIVSWPGLCGLHSKYREGKGKGAYSSSWNSPQNYGMPLVNGITQCYLPPDRGDRPAFTPTGQVGTRFIDPVRMKGWVGLVGWLHTEMVNPSTDGHPSRY